MFKAKAGEVDRVSRLTVVRLGTLISLMVFSLVVGGAFSRSSALTDEDMFVRVAEEVGRSVVSITAVQEGVVHYVDPFEHFFGEDFFEHFFPRRPPRRREAPRPRERVYRRPVMGSGVIIDEAGYILTNEHVIRNADEITVKLPDGREFPGEVTGSDPRSDLAVVRIEGENLPAARLGDSDRLRIGQWVIAIGNPFGFLLDDPQPTLTVGVISALNRSLSGTSLGRGKFYEGLIQTDAAINKGNSGGPLVNSAGEVIGINMAIFSTTGGSQGIGFAIPINTARRKIADLMEGRRITYGWLGVSIQNLTPDLARKFGFPPEERAVLIGEVLEDGPADRAGFRVGDIITEVEGRRIETVSELVRVIGLTPVGKKVEVKIFRDYEEITLTVEIGERPSQPGEAINGQEPWRGIRVQELTEELAEELDLLEKEGVLVSEVERGSPAHEAGLRSGDVIKEIARIEVKNLEDYRKVIGRIEAGEDVLIRTNRGYAIIRGEE